MEENTSNLEVPKQLKGRKKRKFYSKIREQMEFYFSDSNLARDNYLQDLLSKNPDGYVDLEVFKSFNKIKEVTEDLNAIIEALTKSTILQVNEEKTKVRRVTPMGKLKDFDACTLYVEKLPPYADHKWIKDVFEHFGKLDYINIPRYKVSNKIKGFAFIEFSDPECVKKACEFYKRSPRKENIESDDQCAEKQMQKTETCLVKERKSGPESKSDKAQKTDTCSDKEKKARKRKMSSDADEPPQKKESTSDKSSSSKGHGKIDQTSDNDIAKKQASSDRKRKLDSHDDNGRSHKKLKESDSEHPTKASDAEVTETEKHQPSVGNQIALEATDSGNEACKTKRKRKHKKKGHHHSEKPVLRVMSKHEWKVFRNKYLNLQRSTMSYLKQQIIMETQELKEQEQLDEKLENEISNKGLHFQPGVIIKIMLSDSITDPSDMKAKVKAAAHVAFIDAQEGHSEMFTRCHSQEETNFIIQEKKLDNFGTVSLLKGTEEKAYWTKIQEDRKAKFNVPQVRKKRGRDKIIAKAAKLAEHKNKHIYFDE